MVLQHVHDGQPIAWAVPAASGQYSAPVTGLTVSGWTIAPGNPISGPEPPDRTVQLIAAGRVGPRLLCQIAVRYFALDGQWQPYYRMDEQMYFAQKNGHWVPLTLIDGLPSMVTYTPIGFANAAGYYTALHITLTTGPITLSGWTVGHGTLNSLPSP